MLPAFQPLPVTPRQRPFDGSDWLFELKYDGFRALAYLERGTCRLVSRNGHAFSSFGPLPSSRLARL
jgi:bifunctional non-homologous end joining protein LigD